MYIIHFMVNQMAAAIILMGNNIKQCVQRTHQINSMRFNTLNQGAVNSTKSYKISAVLSVLTLYNWTLRSLTCFTPTVLAQVQYIKLELFTFLPPRSKLITVNFYYERFVFVTNKLYLTPDDTLSRFHALLSHTIDQIHSFVLITIILFQY